MGDNKEKVMKLQAFSDFIREHPHPAPDKNGRIITVNVVDEPIKCPFCETVFPQRIYYEVGNKNIELRWSSLTIHMMGHHDIPNYDANRQLLEQINRLMVPEGEARESYIKASQKSKANFESRPLGMFDGITVYEGHSVKL